MRAVLRRREAHDHVALVDEVIEQGPLRMDVDARRCFVNGEEIKLRKKEFALLRLLLENPGRVLTREVLIDRVWGNDYVGDTKTLDVHIKRLRSLIEDDPKAPNHITTVRGVGYRFELTKPAS
jgi:two-component system response regulator RegX3